MIVHGHRRRHHDGGGAKLVEAKLGGMEEGGGVALRP